MGCAARVQALVLCLGIRKGIGLAIDIDVGMFTGLGQRVGEGKSKAVSFGTGESEHIYNYARLQRIEEPNSRPAPKERVYSLMDSWVNS